MENRQGRIEDEVELLPNPDGWFVPEQTPQASLPMPPTASSSPVSIHDLLLLYSSSESEIFVPHQFLFEAHQHQSTLTMMSDLTTM